MSLKTDIVVVNEFSVPTPRSHHRGTRGGTPGRYITRYMARKGATELVTPIRRHTTEDFILRYMARASATEKAVSRDEAKSAAINVSGRGGVAFGYGQVSLSDESVAAASADIQRLFDSGHTVMKTVISFSPEYLQATGVVPQGFVAHHPGDYRGNIDQMRLRMAIMRGLERMGHRFDDLRYVGVIQVDTRHVHCHLAMVDAGRGRVVSQRGRCQQRGKLTSADMSLLRRGVDSWLDENQHVAHMSSAVAYERMNVTAFVKRWTHEKALDESLPQLLLACLPEDRNLWRYRSNNTAMRRANRIVTELVTDVLDQKGSPMQAAMLAVRTYAAKRAAREGLSQVEQDALVNRGRDRIIERSVNGVYQVLAALPPDVVRVRTPTLDVMSQDIETLMATQAQRVRRNVDGVSAESDLAGFSLKLRSYGRRLRDHEEQRSMWRAQAAQWEAASNAGAVGPESVIMHQLYLEEEEYHARCVSKYRQLLGPLAHGLQTQGRSQEREPWADILAQVDEHRRVVAGLEALLIDRSIPKIANRRRAERQGRESHGVSGGGLLLDGAEGRRVLRERLERARAALETRTADLVSELSGHGLVLRAVSDQHDESTDDTDHEASTDTEIVSGELWSLSQTKGMDLHDVRQDSLVDMRVGARVAQRFITWARSRRDLVTRAAQYLMDTNQADVVEQLLPLHEVRAMTTVAQDLDQQITEHPDRHEYVLRSAISDIVPVAARVRRSATVRLDENLSQIVEEHVRTQVRDIVPQIEQVLDTEAEPDGLGG